MRLLRKTSVPAILNNGLVQQAQNARVCVHDVSEPVREECVRAHASTPWRRANRGRKLYVRRYYEEDEKA